MARQKLSHYCSCCKRIACFLSHMTKLLSVTREKLSSWNYYRFHQKPYNAQRRAATKEREAINNTKASYGYKKRNNNIYLNSITILLSSSSSSQKGGCLLWHVIFHFVVCFWHISTKAKRSKAAPTLQLHSCTQCLIKDCS